MFFMTTYVRKYKETKERSSYPTNCENIYNSKCIEAAITSLELFHEISGSLILRPMIKCSNTCCDIWTRFYHRVRVFLWNTNFLKKFHKKQKRKMHAWLVASTAFEAKKLKNTQFHSNSFFVECWFLIGEFLGKRKILEYGSCFDKHWTGFSPYWGNLVQNSKLPV